MRKRGTRSAKKALRSHAPVSHPHGLPSCAGVSMVRHGAEVSVTRRPPGVIPVSVELISVLIAVVAVGATLAGLILSGQRTIRAELAAQRKEFSTELAAQRKEFSTELAALRRDVSAELAAQRKEFGERFVALEQHLAELRERMAHLEGLLDGLREAIAIQRGAA